MPQFGEPKAPEQLENQAEDIKKENPVFSLSEEDSNLSLWELEEKYGEDKYEYIKELRRNTIIERVSKEIDSREFMVEELNKIPPVFYKDIALKLIEKGKIEFLKKNIEKFQYHGLDKAVALKLIEKGENKLLAEKVWYFDSLDKEATLKLIEIGESESVANKLSGPHKFSGLDKDIAIKLIKNYKNNDKRLGDITVGEQINGIWEKELSMFQGIDEEIAILLLEKLGAIKAVAKNINMFGPITDNFLKLYKEIGVDKKELELICGEKEKIKNLTPEGAVKIFEEKVWDNQVKENFGYLKNIIGLQKVFEYKSKHWGETTHDEFLFVDSLKTKNVFSPETLFTLIMEAPNPHELAKLMNQFAPKIFEKIQQTKKEHGEPYIENFNFQSYDEFKHQIELLGIGAFLPADLAPELAEKIMEMQAPGVSIEAILRDVRNGLIVRMAENKEGLDEKVLIQPIKEVYEITPLNEIVKNSLLSQELMKIIPSIGQLIKNEKIITPFGEISIFDYLKLQDAEIRKKIEAEYDLRLKAILGSSVSPEEKEKAKIRLSNERKEAIKKSLILREGGKFVNLQNINIEELYLDSESPMRNFLLEVLSKKEYQKIKEFLEKNDLKIDQDSENQQIFYLLRKLIDLGINGPQLASQAKKLFNDLANFVKDKYRGQITIQQYLGEEIPKNDQNIIRDLLKKYNYEISGKKMIAQIHKKSDPKGWVAGDYTDCCMRYGTSKNYDYMEHLDTAFFTVSVVDEYGQEDMIAQSVLVAAKNNADRTKNAKFLNKEKDYPVLAIDNIEVANRGVKYSPAIAKAYQNFFPKHFPDKLVILGTSYNDDGGLITGELATKDMSYQSLQDLEYSDCFGHSNCYIFYDPKSDTNKEGLHLLGLATYNFSQSPLLKRLNNEELSEAQGILTKIGQGEDDGDGGLIFPDNHSNVFTETIGGKKEVLGYILAADYLKEEDEADEVTVEAFKFLDGVSAAKQEDALIGYLAMKKNIEMPIVFTKEKISPEIVEFLQSKKVKNIGFKVKEQAGKIILEAK